MWQAQYFVKIPQPKNHYVHVTCHLTPQKMPEEVEIFLPCWSPGSYLIREYAKHLRSLKVTNHLGEELIVEVKSKSAWTIFPQRDRFVKDNEYLVIHYEVYCHELSVRTSYIDSDHAFLQGPSYLIGFNAEGSELVAPSIEFEIPKEWSKISTSLPPDESVSREIFRYQAKNFDHLWDCPVQLGCHITDGFFCNNKQYALALWGSEFPHLHNLKTDIKKITSIVNDYWVDVPFDHYLYMINFLPNTYGGLEHSDSTVIMFDGRKLAIKKEYLSFLSLVAHEYCHAWNIKRIRPKELGPFDYQNENYTTMLWLAEGLTRFLDDYFVLLAGLMSLEEYLDNLKLDMNTYYKTAGRKYDTLESSSWGAWIKLYRPHENSINSTISYYLKGGLVFLCLQIELKKKGLSLRSWNHLLWDRYKNNPNEGISKQEFYAMLEAYAGDDIKDFFDDYITTTKEINFLQHFSSAGLEIVWEKDTWDLGVEVEFQGDRIIIKTVFEDGGGYRSGLNAQDEIIAINNLRILKSDWDWFIAQLQENIYYDITVARLGEIRHCQVLAAKSHPKIKTLKILDMETLKKVLEIES